MSFLSPLARNGIAPPWRALSRRPGRDPCLMAAGLLKIFTTQAENTVSAAKHTMRFILLTFHVERARPAAGEARRRAA